MNGSPDKAVDGPSWFVELPTPWPTKVLTLLCRVCVCLLECVVVVVVAGLFTMSLEMFPQMFSSSLMVCLITRAMRSCCGFVAIVSLTWTKKSELNKRYTALSVYLFANVCAKSVCLAFSAKFPFQQRRWRRRVSTSSRSTCN